MPVEGKIEFPVSSKVHEYVPPAVLTKIPLPSFNQISLYPVPPLPVNMSISPAVVSITDAPPEVDGNVNPPTHGAYVPNVQVYPLALTSTLPT